MRVVVVVEEEEEEEEREQGGGWLVDVCYSYLKLPRLHIIVCAQQRCAE